MEEHYKQLETLEGRPLAAADFQGKVTVLSFTDQKSQEISAKVGSALGKRFMHHPRFQILTAVKVPSMFKGLAGALLKTGQAKARDSAVKKFEKEGKPVPEGLAERIQVLFDLNGGCSNSCLSQWREGQARLVLVDQDGRTVAESLDDDPEVAVDRLAPAIEEQLG